MTPMELFGYGRPRLKLNEFTVPDVVDGKAGLPEEAGAETLVNVIHKYTSIPTSSETHHTHTHSVTHTHTHTHHVEQKKACREIHSSLTGLHHHNIAN